MRRFVVKFKVGGAEPWRRVAEEKTLVVAKNAALAMREFYRQREESGEKLTVTEVYEDI